MSDGAKPKDIYLLGVGGTGVGALAGLLKQLGHRVRGSDEGIYPPMSYKLQEWGIHVDLGYDPKHFQPRPDLVVIGNVVRATNPQAVFAREQNLSVMSMPEAVAEFGIGQRHCIVVAGTHGKTSITALCAHVLIDAGYDPGFLVGGALVGYRDSFASGSGEHFVIEGDEYDTAYFDKGPKFVLYRPRSAIITSLEYDHADIFADIAAVEAAFGKFIDVVPQDGHLVVWEGATRARRLLESSEQRTTIYGGDEREGVDLWANAYSSGPEGLQFEPMLDGASLGQMRVPLWGEFSLHNALAVVGVLAPLGLPSEKIAKGLASYRGVRRRFEVLGEPGGVTIVDDFGHHPTAVAATLQAARMRWPQRRIWALFEPRSATNRRNTHQDAYVRAFGGADRVVLGSHKRLEEVPKEERFDPSQVSEALNAAGVEAKAVEDPKAVAQWVIEQSEPGDVLMVFSNGDFGGLHAMLQEGLSK